MHCAAQLPTLPVCFLACAGEATWYSLPVALSRCCDDSLVVVLFEHVVLFSVSESGPFPLLSCLSDVGSDSGPVLMTASLMAFIDWLTMLY